MTKEITYGRKIEVTNYPPAFAARAIFTMLRNMGAEIEQSNAKNTNSIYIVGSLGDRDIEIRISDHSKAISTNTIGGNMAEDPIRINEHWIEADITSAEIYSKFKSILNTI